MAKKRKKIYPDNSIGVRLLESDHQWVVERAREAGIKPGAFLRELVVERIHQGDKPAGGGLK